MLNDKSEIPHFFFPQKYDVRIAGIINFLSNPASTLVYIIIFSSRHQDGLVSGWSP